MNISTHLVLGAGPLGIHIVRRLVDGGRDVALLSRSGSAFDGATTIRADLLDTAQVASAVTAWTPTTDVVYFVAQPAYTRWPEEFPAMQEAAIEVASSLDAVLVVAENLYGYGPVTSPMTEFMPLEATTRKGGTRAAMSEVLFAAHRQGRVRATAGRSSDFFGPQVVRSVLGDLFFGSLLSGRNVPVLADADQPHSWTYIEDFAAALILLGSDERSLGQPWHVPSSEPLTLRQIVAFAAAAAGRQSPAIDVVPVDQVEALAAIDPMMAELFEMVYEFDRPFVLDFSAFTRMFDMTPTAVDTAIRSTVQWFSTIAAAS